MTLLIVVASLTLAASFFCSLFEAALYALSPTQVALMRQTGRPAALRLARLRDEIDAPIAAILTVNTIAHTAGATWCGALVATIWGDAAVGVFAGIFTFLVLAVTEIVPKSLGVRYAPQLGVLIAWPIQLMVWGTYPLVYVARIAMRALTGGGGEHGPSEQEVIALAGLAARSGAVRREERRWVEGVLRLDKLTAKDLRTPRTVTETLDASLPVADAVADPSKWHHSRIPVIDGGDPDQLVGVVHRREAFDAAVQGSLEGLLLSDLARPVRFVPETLAAHRLLELFLEEREHLVAVTDEYGGFEGVVTLEDVLESMLGSEIVDEHDQVEDLRALALERAKKRRGVEAEQADESSSGS